MQSVMTSTWLVLQQKRWNGCGDFPCPATENNKFIFAALEKITSVKRVFVASCPVPLGIFNNYSTRALDLVPFPGVGNTAAKRTNEARSAELFICI